METIQWITIRLMSDEFEASNNTLVIEVRVFEQYGELFAEPLYAKSVNGADDIEQDCHQRNKHLQPGYWKLIEFAVAGEFNADILAWYRETHEAFADLRDDDQVQQGLDRDWYISKVL